MRLLNLLKSVWHYLKKDKWLLFFCCFIFLIVAIMDLSEGYLVGASTEAIAKMDFASFLFFLFILLMIYCLTEPLNKLSQYIFCKIELRFTEKLSFDVFKKTICLPIVAYEEKSSGEILNRITSDTENITELLDSIVTIGLDLFTCLILSIYIFLNSWIVGLFILFYIILIVFISRYYMPKLKSCEEKITGQNDKYISDVTECIHGIREIKSLGVKHNILRGTKETIRILFQTRVKSLTIRKKYQLSINMLTDVFIVSTFLLCGFLVYRGLSTITFLVAMTWYIYRYTYIVQTFSNLVEIYQKVVVALGRIKEILDNTLYQDEPFGKKRIDKVEGNICFDHVSFGYPNEKVLLEDFNLTLEKNKKIAIVGKSGQGKTTLFNLLLRFFDPLQGNIFIDQYHLSDFDEESLRKHISIIRQEPFVFHRTILENFQILNSNVTKEEVRKYCQMAQIDDYIMSLDQNYDTLLGEDGVNLSGGQKQRLAIARTLMKQTKIILFDEATSALDNTSQTLIKKAIDVLSKDHTVIVIAHRLSTIIDADIICLIDQGRLQDQGTHQELMARNALYRALYKQEDV